LISLLEEGLKEVTIIAHIPKCGDTKLGLRLSSFPTKIGTSSSKEEVIKKEKN